jgi:hypothetical protein
VAVAEHSGSWLKLNYEYDTDPVDRVRAFFSQVCCRHAYVKRTSSGRLFLECLHCRHTTPGITPRAEGQIQ